ncbi:MAG TPA: ankyrin repeat domain-containing protein [Rickettsiales bacterium]|nr:ankyrin repeat domain-containing protein [Rickettsiales bacterium]
MALNLGKENIDLMKVSDMKSSLPSVVEVTKENEEITPKLDINDNNLVVDQDFSSESADFTNPYIESDNFGELLPEDEIGNVVLPEEEQGPKFLDSVKNKLIEATKSSTIVGDKIEGPSFIDNIKEKILDTSKEKKSEEVASDKTETVIKKENEKNVNLFDKIGDKITTYNIKDSTNSIIDTIKDKALVITNKIINTEKGNVKILAEKPDKSNKNNIIDESKIKIVGNLFDSELNQVQEDKDKSKVFKDILVKDNLTYQENEDFERFLKNKELKDLTNPEKILIPSITPQKKELSTYNTQKVPQELLEARSFQNRHIPTIIQNKEKQKIIEKIIEYGMLDELKAFMKENLKDANVVMDNQYTLLTYATKYRQYDIMKYLIRKGADVNKRDDRLDTPLIITVRNNDLKGVELLTDFNANLDKIDIIKRTPLIIAIEKNYDDIAIYLIDNGANIDVKNGIGEGILAMSVRLGRINVREKILSILRQYSNNTIVKNEEAISDKNTTRN